MIRLRVSNSDTGNSLLYKDEVHDNSGEFVNKGWIHVDIKARQLEVQTPYKSSLACRNLYVGELCVTSVLRDLKMTNCGWLFTEEAARLVLSAAQRSSQ